MIGLDDLHSLFSHSDLMQVIVPSPSRLIQLTSNDKKFLVAKPEIVH